MSTASLARYLAAAVAASLAAAVLHRFLAPFVGARLLLHLLVIALAGLGLAAIRARAGRPPFTVLVATLWGLASLGLLLAPLPLIALVTAEGALLWLARCLWWSPGPLRALADGAIALVATAAFAWGLSEAGSVGIALWCWALAHGACLFLAPAPVRGAAAADRYERAHRSALAALDRLGPAARRARS